MPEPSSTTSSSVQGRPNHLGILDDDDVQFVEETPEFSFGQYLVASAEQMLIMFGIYVLSIGPMYWTWVRAKHVEGNFFVAAFYEPLWRICEFIPPLREWLNWYVRLWNL